MSRRIDVEADDVGELCGELRIARPLEGAHPVRLELMRLPRCAAPNAARCPPPSPSLGRSSGSPRAAGRRRSAPPPAPPSRPGSAACRACASCRAAARPRPASAKRCCQRQTIGRLTPTCAATRCTGSPPRRREHDARPLHMLALPVAIRRDRLQPLPIRRAHDHAYCLCHADIPSMSRDHDTNLVNSPAISYRSGFSVVTGMHGTRGIVFSLWAPQSPDLFASELTSAPSRMGTGRDHGSRVTWLWLVRTLYQLCVR